MISAAGETGRVSKLARVFLFINNIDRENGWTNLTWNTRRAGPLLFYRPSSIGPFRLHVRNNSQPELSSSFAAALPCQYPFIVRTRSDRVSSGLTRLFFSTFLLPPSRTDENMQLRDVQIDWNMHVVFEFTSGVSCHEPAIFVPHSNQRSEISGCFGVVFF